MSDSKSGPVTSVSNKSTEDAAAAKQKRARDLDFNRWEKEYLNLAFPVVGVITPGNSDDAKGPITEDVMGVVAFDLYPHVPTNAADARDELLASFNDDLKAKWESTPEPFQQMMIEAFAKNRPKSEFPTVGKLEELPMACMRMHPYGGWELYSRIPDCGVPDHIAILAVNFAVLIRPRLQKHRRGVDVLETMIEAFGFYMATEEVDEKGEKTGNWTSRTRKPNEDLAADLHAAVLPGK